MPPDHTYGILVKADKYGAGDLLHNRDRREYLRGLERDRGIIAAIRAQLKKANYHNFHDLVAAFRFYDKVTDAVSRVYRGYDMYSKYFITFFTQI